MPQVAGGARSWSGGGSSGIKDRSDAPAHWDSAHSDPEGNFDDYDRDQDEGGTCPHRKFNIVRRLRGASFGNVLKRPARPTAAVGLGQSGVRSVFAGRDPGDAGNAPDDGEATSAGNSEGSERTESSPLTEDGTKKEQRGGRRRFLRAAAGVVLLAVLSGSVIAQLVPREERRALLEGLLLEYNVLARLLGGGGAEEKKVAAAN